jgi:hypothetical protein
MYPVHIRSTLVARPYALPAGGSALSLHVCMCYGDKWRVSIIYLLACTWSTLAPGKQEDAAASTASPLYVPSVASQMMGSQDVGGGTVASTFRAARINGDSIERELFI